MNWTKEKPTTSGIYWYVTDINGFFPPKIVDLCVIIPHEDSELVIEDGFFREAYEIDRQGYSIVDQTWTGYWAGPIEHPQLKVS